MPPLPEMDSSNWGSHASWPRQKRQAVNQGYPKPPRRGGAPQSKRCTGNRSGNRSQTNTANTVRATGSMAQPEKSAGNQKLSPSEPQTTVMIRNLPESYTRNQLQELLDSRGFKGLYDFIYMPMNFRTKASFSYAFANFVGHEEAQRCMSEFESFASWGMDCDKVCDVSWSNMHQGLMAHIERYRNSPVMHESVLDEYKPAVFKSGTGERLQFPPPQKKVRVPRIRRLGSENSGRLSARELAGLDADVDDFEEAEGDELPI